MGVFCLARRLFLLFYMSIHLSLIPTKQGGLPTSEGVVPTMEGVIPTSEGCILTSEGVILTKQAIFGPYFARTNTLKTQNSHQSALFAQKTPCFGNICDSYSYPTDICTHRETFWCIGIMDLRSKIQRGGGGLEQNTQKNAGWKPAARKRLDIGSGEW
jgi:hypothetical protein